ncbi:hypothetical protein [Streptomyces sp. NPDC057910]|uniref:hypothetical protein n=1 Tax=Streptomyces sp. NPDC057910 TaxID=3346278 RepID=UPI0036E5E2B6
MAAPGLDRLRPHHRHRAAAGTTGPHQGLSEKQIAALRRLDVALREKANWKMLYESAARADEVLCLNVEDLYPQDKSGRIIAKGGATEWIHWQSGTAQLLPRLIAGRTRGPLFLIVKAVEAHTDARWVILYVKRWLQAPLQLPDGAMVMS